MLRQVTFAIFVAAATGRYKEALARLGGHISPVLRPKPPHTGTASGTNPGASSKQPHTRLVERPPRIQLIGVQTNRSEKRPAGGAVLWWPRAAARRVRPVFPGV